MNLLNFSQKYETELIELWNRCMIHDQISILKFRKQVLYDENFESSLCLLAVEGEQLIGFILGMTEVSVSGTRVGTGTRMD